jgi:hypothetical protein
MSYYRFFMERLWNLHILFALLTLLGVQFVFLGIAIGGLISAPRKQEQIKSYHRPALSFPQDESV